MNSLFSAFLIEKANLVFKMKLSSMFLLPVSLPSSQRTVLLKIICSNFEGIENNLDLKKYKYLF